MTIFAPDQGVENSDAGRADGSMSGRGVPPEKREETDRSGVSPRPQAEAIHSVRPTKAFIRSRLAYFIAFGGGAGLSSFAPGTMGTLAAFPLFWILGYWFDPLAFLILLGVMFLVGVWACGVTGRALGNHDHGGMVWDETVAFLLVLFFTPPFVTWQAIAFLLFRLFDIIKPPPIGYYDRKLRGGFGVMFDDLLAAFLTLLCLAAWKALGIGSLI